MKALECLKYDNDLQHLAMLVLSLATDPKILQNTVTCIGFCNYWLVIQESWLVAMTAKIWLKDFRISVKLQTNRTWMCVKRIKYFRSNSIKNELTTIPNLNEGGAVPKALIRLIFWLSIQRTECLSSIWAMFLFPWVSGLRQETV